MPVNSQSVAYPTLLGDAGKSIVHGSASAHTFTITGAVAYPVGTTITFENPTGMCVLTISITTDTMYLAGAAATTGSRTLTAVGIATAHKYAAGLWIISGTNLT